MIQTVCKECGEIFKSTDRNEFKNLTGKLVKVDYTEFLVIINCDCGNKVCITK